MHVDKAKPRLSHFIVLLGFFFLSVIIRIPNLDRPLSANYEWVTAHTLVTLRIWNDEGILEHGFKPIYTFDNVNDHFIKCPISGVSDDEGNYYYISYPPLSFLIPFIVFRTTGTYPDVLPIQILNLVFHFTCVILLFLILLKATNREGGTETKAAFIGAGVYIFSPLNLWNHSNVYFADIVVQLFFLMFLYGMITIIPLNKNRRNYSLLFISLSLAMLTEWLGFFLAFTLFVYLLSPFGKRPGRSRMVFATCLTTLAALSFLLIYYGSIDGIHRLIETLWNRYVERSGHYGDTSLFRIDSHLYLLTNYVKNYFPYLIMLLINSIFFLILRGERKSRINEKEFLLIFFSSIPVILHHLILFDFTIDHDISLVKTSVLFSLLIGFTSRPVLESISRAGRQVECVIWYLSLAVMFTLGTYFYYSHLITPDEYSLKRLGDQIKETSTHDETIFFKTTRTLGDYLIVTESDFVVAPQIHFYSGRCIQVVSSTADAIAHLKQYNQRKGVVYSVNNVGLRPTSLERIRIP